jgi:hypothetical protein
MASQEHKSEPMNLQLLIDSNPALIHTGLPNGELDDFNQTSLTYVGLALEDLSGWKWAAAIHPEDVAAMVEKRRAAQVFISPCPGKSRMLDEG